MKFCSVLKRVSEDSIEQAPVIQYLPGWETSRPLENVLLESSRKDRKSGHTNCGPHRAEISVTVNGKPIVKVWSSGQLKLYVAAFLLAKAIVVKNETGKTPLLLIDDLAAELDLSSRQLFMGMLKFADAQIFITSTDRRLIPVTPEERRTVFHVEQGRVTKVLQ